MDGTTEPIVAVIGHPIAGNPSQFALERALVELDLDWRVLSFDVPPERLAAALSGIDVLGFRGVLLDPTAIPAATEWYRRALAESGPIDCFTRDDQGGLVGLDQRRRWTLAQVRAYIERVGRGVENALWLGDPAELDWLRELCPEPTLISHDLDQVAAAELIVVATSAPLGLEIEDWPLAQSPRLVVDFGDGHPQIEEIRSLGYEVLTAEAARIGVLARSLHDWSGRQPSKEVIQEAIEEYLAV